MSEAGPAGLPFLQDVVNVQQPEAGPGSDVDKEIKAYLADEQSRLSASDILVWWFDNQGTYPILSMLARKFLAVPATSLHSEQYFSHVGNVQTNRRCSLSARTVQELSFLHLNADVHTVMGLGAAELRKPLSELKW